MHFPHPEEADIHGLLCMGGDLTPERLVEAYSQGIFPWPQQGLPLLWFSPPRRGVLDFSEFRVPRSVKRLLLKEPFVLTMNQAFPKVIQQCASIPRDGETGTWILPEMQEAYSELHRRGIAHSVEAWQNGELVGGLYGVFVNGLFSGESMFYKVSGASKACLVHLVNDLRARGCTWMDIQMVTPVLQMFGGKYISRAKFLERLKVAPKKRSRSPGSQ